MKLRYNSNMLRFSFIFIFLITIFGVFSLNFLSTPGLVYAAGTEAGFVPLVGIPFIDEKELLGEDGAGLAGYANSLYRAAITIAAILAVIKIVIAGVQYMLTDVVPQKSQAKKSIRTALLGLLIVVGAVLILNTINPSLTNLKVLNLQQLSGEISSIDADFLGDSDFVTACKSIGAGTDCSIQTCVTLDSEGWLTRNIPGYSYITTITDSLWNRASCEVKCEWIGGERIAHWTDSGTCVYPNDMEVVRDSLRKEIVSDIETETDLSVSDIDFETEVPEDQIEEDIYRDPRLRTAVVHGYYYQEELVGDDFINPEELQFAILEPKCKAMTDNKGTVISISSIAAVNGTGFYCVSKK